MRNVDTQMSAVFISEGDDEYRFPDGSVLAREFGTETPNGNLTDGAWVYRYADGSWGDYSSYRHDLADRFNVRLELAK
jgi:hypothetical protein